MTTLFSHEVQGTKLHFDPLKVRRLLLENSDGRCWTYIRDLQGFKRELEVFQSEEAGDLDTLRRVQLEALIAINLKSTARLEGILAHAAHEAFEFQPVDVETGQGVGEEDCLNTLQAFMEFAEGKE